MKTLTVSDGGNRFILRVREDVAIAPTERSEKPPHLQFLDVWSDECKKMGIPFARTAIELRVAKQLLRKYTLRELKAQARACRLDHGEEFREEEYESSLIFFSIKLKQSGGSMLEEG